MSRSAKVSGSVVAGFPSPAEQYLEPPLDLNELLVKRPAATYFVRIECDTIHPCKHWAKHRMNL